MKLLMKQKVVSTSNALAFTSDVLRRLVLSGTSKSVPYSGGEQYQESLDKIAV